MTTTSKLNELVEEFKGRLKAETGKEMDVFVYASGFDKRAFQKDCMAIREYVRTRPICDTLMKPRTDKYYIALWICMQRHPGVADRYFAEVFQRDRTTIISATKKIANIMLVDEKFNDVAHTLLKNVFANAHLSE